MPESHRVPERGELFQLPTPISRLVDWNEERLAQAFAKIRARDGDDAAAAGGGKDNAAVAVGSDNAAVAGGGDSATGPGGAAGAARPASRGGRIDATADPEPCRDQVGGRGPLSYAVPSCLCSFPGPSRPRAAVRASQEL